MSYFNPEEVTFTVCNACDVCSRDATVMQQAPVNDYTPQLNTKISPKHYRESCNYQVFGSSTSWKNNKKVTDNGDEHSEFSSVQSIPVNIC